MRPEQVPGLQLTTQDRKVLPATRGLVPKRITAHCRVRASDLNVITILLFTEFARWQPRIDSAPATTSAPRHDACIVSHSTCLGVAAPAASPPESRCTTHWRHHHHHDPWRAELHSSLVALALHVRSYRRRAARRPRSILSILQFCRLHAHGSIRSRYPLFWLRLSQPAATHTACQHCRLALSDQSVASIERWSHQSEGVSTRQAPQHCTQLSGQEALC